MATQTLGQLAAQASRGGGDKTMRIMLIMQMLQQMGKMGTDIGRFMKDRQKEGRDKESHAASMARLKQLTGLSMAQEARTQETHPLSIAGAKQSQAIAGAREGRDVATADRGNMQFAAQMDALRRKHAGPLTEQELLTRQFMEDQSYKDKLKEIDLKLKDLATLEARLKVYTLSDAERRQKTLREGTPKEIKAEIGKITKETETATRRAGQPKEAALQQGSVAAEEVFFSAIADKKGLGEKIATSEDPLRRLMPM